MNDVTDVIIDEKIKQTIHSPSKYKVILLNDESTPMEWVVDILVDIFKHSETTAQQLMLTVHETGSAIAGTYSFEIAEQKSTEAVTLSRDHGFPLQFKLEQE
jgi:ATP-dependent Clp protease adaptor protein ClpS|tara:strand:+ start:374 stop:679 length:306 start_codon:yes stop_codon:yes gene_type:complete